MPAKPESKASVAKLAPSVTEFIVDAYGCRADLSAAAPMEAAMRRAVAAVGAHVVDSVSCRFQPHGLTICLVLKESHLLLSTWPEFELCIVNVFLCNDTMDPRAVWRALEAELKPEETRFHEVRHELGRRRKAA